MVKKADGTKEILYRADRVLANRSGKSRSECFELLKQKRIFQQLDNNNNNSSDSAKFQVVSGPSAKLSMKAALFVDQCHEIPMPPPLLQVYHKPKWVLSVRHDPQGRPCLDKDNLLPDMHPVGRLDYDTSGLLLFSSSGALTQTLLHPKHGIEKEYVAVVAGTVDASRLQEMFEKGVQTSEGVHTATLLETTHFFESDTVQPYLQDIRTNLPPEYNQTDLKLRGHLNVLEATTELSTVRLMVSEGKHRMVRRILANCGHPVVSLKRERLGVVALGDLPEGQHRPLTIEEEAWAERLLPQKNKR